MMPNKGAIPIRRHLSGWNPEWAVAETGREPKQKNKGRRCDEQGNANKIQRLSSEKEETPAPLTNHVQFTNRQRSCIEKREGRVIGCAMGNCRSDSSIRGCCEKKSGQRRKGGSKNRADDEKGEKKK